MPNELTKRAAPARRPLTDRVRLGAGTVLGDAAALASRVLGKGSGASIRGQVLTRVHPGAFGTLVKALKSGKPGKGLIGVPAGRLAAMPDAAALLEVLPGLFLQTFGIGHIYAGNVATGLIIMFSYWAVAFVNFLLCFVFIGFITWPLCWVAALVISSLTAANACKSR